MSFHLFGGVCVPATLDTRPAVEPGIVPTDPTAVAFVRLFALDCLPAGRRLLMCPWHCADGQLVCIWELADEVSR
jgi:hypothetical protein